MRILFVTAHYPPDFVSGATLQVQRLAEQAAAAGHDVAVFSGAIRRRAAPTGRPPTDRSAVSPCAGSARPAGSSRTTTATGTTRWPLRRARRCSTSSTPDVVHAHALQTLGAGVLDDALDRGIRVVLTMHDLWWWCSRLFLVDREMRPARSSPMPASVPAPARRNGGRSGPLLCGATLDRIDEILVPSPVMATSSIANGVDPRRVSVDENDVEVRSPPDAGAARSDGDVQFVYVGGDHPVKGVDVMLDAAGQPARSRSAGALTTYGVEQRRLPRGLPVMFRPPRTSRRRAGAVFCREPTCSSSRRSPARASRSPPERRCCRCRRHHERLPRSGGGGAPRRERSRRSDRRRGGARRRDAPPRRGPRPARVAPGLRRSGRRPCAASTGRRTPSLLARYGKPRRRAPAESTTASGGRDRRRPRRRPRRADLADALEHHGIGRRDRCRRHRVGAGARRRRTRLFVHGSLQPEQLQSLTDAARRGSAVVIDAADILPTGSAPPRSSPPDRSKLLVVGASWAAQRLASRSSPSGTAKSHGGVHRQRRRRPSPPAHCSMSSSPPRSSEFRACRCRHHPSAADGTRAWMLASLAGAAAIVDVEIDARGRPGAPPSSPGRDTEWTVHLSPAPRRSGGARIARLRGTAGGDAAPRTAHRGCHRRPRSRCQRFAERRMTAAGYNRCVRPPRATACPSRNPKSARRSSGRKMRARLAWRRPPSR